MTANADRSSSAVLFDMDGVVTDTATAHAAAWKRLFDEFLAAQATRTGTAHSPFDAVQDYRRYVDGKPRSDGVQSFLDARGIEIPYGNADDGPDQETVCGLGARKDRYFKQWLDGNTVQSWPGTRALIRRLRSAGMPIAVFSSSRNAGAVLRSAGLSDQFDARVDGQDLARLGIAGKPDPAMLLEAAARLGAEPQHSTVIEDAVAGIRAGVRGGFDRVIGVARGSDGGDLVTAGADCVVEDLAELAFSGSHRLVVKTLATLPSVWERQDDIGRHLHAASPVVFLDYDGTLTPIVDDHRRAHLSEDMRAAIDRVSRQHPVAIVSGRDLSMLQRLVGLERVLYAGSHGFEIAPWTDAHSTASPRTERGTEFLPALDDAERALRDALAPIDGHAIERKRFSIAVHFRNVAAADCARVAAVVGDVLTQSPQLRLGHGKKVYEIQPDMDWDKGRAVDWILTQRGLDGTDALPVYVGDDITDEAAFRALAGRGLCIAVRGDENPPGENRRTAADYSLRDSADVERFLGLLASHAGSGTSGPVP